MRVNEVLVDAMMGRVFRFLEAAVDIIVLYCNRFANPASPPKLGEGVFIQVTWRAFRL